MSLLGPAGAIRLTGRSEEDNRSSRTAGCPAPSAEHHVEWVGPIAAVRPLRCGPGTSPPATAVHHPHGWRAETTPPWREQPR